MSEGDGKETPEVDESTNVDEPNVVTKAKWRANYLPSPHYFNLNHACLLINRAMGDFGCYLVGSSIRTREYRDVDVRFIMDDAAYDRMFKDENGWVNPLWSLMCMSVSMWLSQQSALPIDFQIQRRTQANADHSIKTGHERQPLGIFLDYPGERPTDIAPKENPGAATKT